MDYACWFFVCFTRCVFQHLGYSHLLDYQLFLICKSYRSAQFWLTHSILGPQLFSLSPHPLSLSPWGIVLVPSFGGALIDTQVHRIHVRFHHRSEVLYQSLGVALPNASSLAQPGLMYYFVVFSRCFTGASRQITISFTSEQSFARVCPYALFYCGALAVASFPCWTGVISKISAPLSLQREWPLLVPFTLHSYLI